MRALGAVVCVVAMVGVVQAATGQAKEKVGGYGDPLRLVVKGTEHFAAEKVEGALFSDLDVLLAAHPAAPLRPYLSLLCDKATAGYLHAGFRDAKVTANVDEETGATIVTVEEGPQFLAGKVRVVAAGEVPAEFLAERLTQPCRPPHAVASASGTRMADLEGDEIEPEIALWPQGKPAAFDSDHQENITRRVRDALSDLGYVSPDFSIDFPQAGPTTADLVVRVADQGPRATADAIEVVGNRRHTRQEILDYLGVKPGMPLTRQTCADMEYRLWQSGRFRWQKVASIVPDTPRGPFRLRIEVEEYAGAPRLSDELSEVDATLLRCQRWMCDIASADDIVAESNVQGFPLIAVLAPGKGLLVQGADHAAVVADDRIGLYSMKQGKKLVAPAAQCDVDLSYGFRLAREDVDDSDRLFEVVFSMRFDSGKQRRGGPLDLLVSAQPAACLALAHEHGATCSINEGVLTVQDDHGQLRIDVDSGRLIERIVSSSKTVEPVRITTMPGEFERQLRDIDARTADFPNAYDPRRPVTSWVRFLRDDPLVGEGCRLLWKLDGETPPPREKRLAAVWKLLDYNVLAPLDRAVAEQAPLSRPERRPFVIPGGQNPAELLSLDNAGDAALALCLLAADFLFPRDSWPSTFVREAGMCIVDKSDPEYFYAELTDLYASSKTGPLCCLVCAAALHSTLPRTAGGFAQKGLARLSLEDFRKDRDVLLDREHYLRPVFLAAGDALRELDDQETEALFAGMPADVNDGLRAALARLRERPDVPVADLLDDALDDAWQGGWQSAAERALRGLLVGLAQQ